jgi:predicted class III extradiol MEMO1 family dioxygenase
LQRELSNYLTTAATAAASESSSPNASAMISPHAGFSFSGPTAGYAYRALADRVEAGKSSSSSGDDEAKVLPPLKRIIVLHPSHHVYLENAAISNATALETPLGNLAVDEELRASLLSEYGGKKGEGGLFRLMKQREDEEEHSGEMQYVSFVIAFVFVVVHSLI